jgi:hypothetical protein
MKKNTPLSFTMLINRFKGSCGTFGEEKKTLILFLFLNNDHGVDVSIDNNIFKIY